MLHFGYCLVLAEPQCWVKKRLSVLLQQRHQGRQNRGVHRPNDRNGRFAEGGCDLLHRGRYEKTCIASELVLPLGHAVYIDGIFQEIECRQLTRSLNEGALLAGEVNSSDTHAVLADCCLNR